MNAKLFRPVAGLVTTAKLVILYDELETLLAANQRLEHLSPEMEKKPEWVVNSWRFDMLGPDWRLEAYRALEEAADAGVVLVAICDLPASADVPMDWLETWAGLRRVREAKLIVMPFGFAPGRKEFATLVGRLRRLAKLHDLSCVVFNGASTGKAATRTSRTFAPGATPSSNMNFLSRQSNPLEPYASANHWQPSAPA